MGHQLHDAEASWMDHASANAAALSLWAKSLCSEPSFLQGSCSQLTTPSLNSM